MLFGAIVHCNKNPVEIDYNQFAETFGLKNAASARTAWAGVRKKIKAVAGPPPVKHAGNYLAD